MVKLVLLVTDVFDAGASDTLNAAHIILEQFLVGQPNFATNHDLVGRRKCFAGNTCLWLLRQKRIENRVRNSVADLIWVAFGNRFRSENIVFAYHVTCSISYNPPRQEAVVAAFVPA